MTRIEDQKTHEFMLNVRCIAERLAAIHELVEFYVTMHGPDAKIPAHALIAAAQSVPEPS